ncbi:hypothetical protein [Nostoc sp. 106C]|nr:hypothetical protein [Nostoc sp. 106C]
MSIGALRCATKHPRLSDRSALIKLLNDLPSQQLDMLLIAVDVPNNVIPPLTAPQGDRVSALLRWVEGSTGCGLQVLQQVLAEILPLPNNDEIVTAELWNIPYLRNPSNKTLDIHRLVQEVLKAEMDEDSRRLWAERTVCAVTQVFPNAEYANWQDCERLLPYARIAIDWISQYKFEFETAALLLQFVSVKIYNYCATVVSRYLFISKPDPRLFQKVGDLRYLIVQRKFSLE